MPSLKEQFIRFFKNFKVNLRLIVGCADTCVSFVFGMAWRGAFERALGAGRHFPWLFWPPGVRSTVAVWTRGFAAQLSWPGAMGAFRRRLCALPWFSSSTPSRYLGLLLRRTACCGRGRRTGGRPDGRCLLSSSWNWTQVFPNMQSWNKLGLFLFTVLLATQGSHFFGIKNRRKKACK